MASTGSSAGTSSSATRKGNDTTLVMCGPTGTCRLKPWPTKRRSRVKASQKIRSASVGLRRRSRASPRTCRRPEELDLLQLAFKRTEEGEQLLLRRLGRPDPLAEWQARAGQLEPLVSDDDDRLGEIERGEGRIDRQGDDAVGERDFVVFEPDPLATEQDAYGL